MENNCDEKSWWKSKIVWLGIANFLLGFLSLLGEFLTKSDFSPLALTTLISGIILVALRVFFTDTSISR